MQIYTNPAPVPAMSLIHFIEKIHGVHWRFDAVKTDITSQFNGQVNLGFKDGKLMVDRNRKGGQFSRKCGKIIRNTKSSVNSDFSEHRVRKGFQIGLHIRNDFGKRHRLWKNVVYGLIFIEVFDGEQAPIVLVLGHARV